MQTRHRVLLLAIILIAASVFSFQLGSCSRGRGGSQVSDEDRLKQMQFRQEDMWITFYQTRMLARWVITCAGVVVTGAGVLLTLAQTVILIMQGGAQYYARIAGDNTEPAPGKPAPATEDAQRHSHFRIDIFRGTAGLILVASGIMLLRVDLTNPVVINTERQWWSAPPPWAGETQGLPAKSARSPGPPPAVDAPIATRPGVPELPTKPAPGVDSLRLHIIANEQPLAESFELEAKVNEPILVKFRGDVPPGVSVSAVFVPPSPAAGCCIQNINDSMSALCRFDSPGPVDVRYTLVTESGFQSEEATVKIRVVE